MHRHGIFHRDRQPRNIGPDEADRPLVQETGFARIHEAASLTKTGILLGTPGSTAPEPVIGDRLDHR